MANQLEIQAILARSQYDQLFKKYGDPYKWRTAGFATVLGAEVAEGYNKWANAQLEEKAIQTRQDEVSARVELSIQNIEQQSKAVQALQKTAFIKSGVKLEGSAINVLTETALEAAEAKKVRQREADFENRQMEVEKALNAVRAKYAPVNTLLSIAPEAFKYARDMRRLSEIDKAGGK